MPSYCVSTPGFVPVWLLSFEHKLCPRPFCFLIRIYASVVSACLVAVFFFLFLFFDSLARGCSRILRISSSVIFLSVLNLVRSGVGGALKRVIPFLVTATVVNRRHTASLSLSPMTSYWRRTPPRTHSTTPTLPARSSSNWRIEKGKVPNFLTTSERVALELGLFRP